MSYYFISVGGTGAKILEALTHLTVAGVLPGDKELNVIALDPDTGNGNLARTKSTLEQVEQFQNAQLGAGTSLFKNKLNVWQPLPFNPLPTIDGKNVDNLDQVMSAVIIGNQPLGQLYKVLYSNKERQTSLDVGFRGHPSIGAAVLAKQYIHSEQWNTLQQQISDEIGHGHANDVKVFLAGSIFGGTGAAGIPTIAHLLRQKFKNNISIGGVFMLPYFMFRPEGDEEGIFAKSENFLTNAKAALKYYSQGDKDFDEMYFLGDNAVVNSNFSIGGPQQENKAHIVDLYGALAAVDFFGKAPASADGTDRVVNYNYICRNNSVEFVWQDLQDLAPDFKKLFIQFCRFVLTYVQFIKPTLDNPPVVDKGIVFTNLKWGGRPENPWYEPIAYNEDLSINYFEPDSKKIENFNKYIITYCTWLKQLETVAPQGSVPNGRTVSLINPNVFDVVTDKQGHSHIFVHADRFNLCDPTENGNGLTLDAISQKLYNTHNINPNAQGFGKLLRHVYDSCI